MILRTFILTGFVAVTAFAQNKIPFVPASVIDGWVKDYGKEDLELIKTDLTNIRGLIFRNKTGGHDKPKYIATAGGPASAKSTILETVLHDRPDDYVYIDPDQRALRFMHSYIQSLNLYQISQSPSYQDALKFAYTKWRGGSNYIAITLLNEAYEGKYHIALGATSTAPTMAEHYKNLKDQGYSIELLLCGSSDEARVEAANHRATTQAFIQVSPEDLVEKGKAFFERMPLYFTNADKLQIYWTDSYKTGFVLAATFEQSATPVIHNASAYKRFLDEYEKRGFKSQDLIKAREQAFLPKG